jgi:hypothetical protein
MEHEGSLPSLLSLAAWTLTQMLTSYFGSPGLIWGHSACGTCGRHKMVKEQILLLSTSVLHTNYYSINAADSYTFICHECLVAWILTAPNITI